MNFDTGTWWLITIILAALIGLAGFLIKRSLFGKVDSLESKLDKCVAKEEYCKTIVECKEDIKKIKEEYTPKTTHTKDLDECRNDIKKIKEDYITKQDFFREQAKTDRKLDKIMDILLEMKGDKK